MVEKINMPGQMVAAGSPRPSLRGRVVPACALTVLLSCLAGPSAWAEGMRDHCREAGTPFFLKQLGSFAFRGDQRLRLTDSHGGDWTEWPEGLRVRQMPVYVGHNGLPGVRQRRIEYELQCA